MVEVLARFEVRGEAATGTSADAVEAEERAAQHGEMATGADGPILGRPRLMQRSRIQAEDGLKQIGHAAD
jgi:hypothetical protein